MKIKKILTLVIAIAGLLAIVLYFAVPSIARSVIRNKLSENAGNSIGSIDVSWSGPQVISKLHIVDTLVTADIDVTISNSLLSLIMASSQIDVLVQGDANIIASKTTEKTPEQNPGATSSKEPTQKESANYLPAVKLVAELATVTINGDEPIQFHDVAVSVDLDPGMHFTAAVQAASELGGMIDIDCTAPSFISKSGELNWDASATCNIDIDNTPIPAINGIGGWSILKLEGRVSSPNLNDAINISIDGSLTEYDTPRGSILAKGQFLKSDGANNAFTFAGKEFEGTIDLLDVPTTILDPFLNTIRINTARDVGTTMDLSIRRKVQEPTLTAHFNAKEVQIDGVVDTDNWLITNANITASVHDELLQLITDNQLSGEATVAVHIDQLVPVGNSSNDKPECAAQINIAGNLNHIQTRTNLTSLDCNFVGELDKRTIAVDGFATLNEKKSAFTVSLKSLHKNKLDGLDDLWKTITSQLPQGTGHISVSNIPTSIIRTYVTDQRIKLNRDVGPTVLIDAKLNHNLIEFNVKSEKITTTGTALLQGNDIQSFRDLMVKAEIAKALASEFAGINKTATINALFATADLNWNTEFNATIQIEKSKTVLMGKSTRNEDDSLDVTVAATGIPSMYIYPILYDSIGSPVSVEIIVKNILDIPVITAGGTSPNSTFETSLRINSEKVSTVEETTTRADLKLSPSLTQRLLKDLGPVLSDIRSVSRPIKMTVSNAEASLDNDVSKLKADIILDIGEVMLDNGSLTLDLLSMFKTKHNETIPAQFEQIHIKIRKGVVRYEKFRLLLANKYLISYSGSINLVTRKINVQCIVPLTSLGHSIKELRGLPLDIDVPINITGSLDSPKSSVDNSFDLEKLLEGIPINEIGDVIDGLLGGNKKGEGPDPLDILDELFGN